MVSVCHRSLFLLETCSGGSCSESEAPRWYVIINKSYLEGAYIAVVGGENVTKVLSQVLVKPLCHW